MAKVVIVGSFNMDLITYMQRMPERGETVHGARFLTGPGGKGSNQAVAAARLGADVTFVGRVGQDMFGDTAVDLWSREGINTRWVVRDPDHATGVAPILVEEATAENTIVVVLGANNALSAADVDAARNEIASADVLLTQLETPLETTEHALRLAKQHGAVTILNPAPAATTQLPRALLELVDYLTPNETELNAMLRLSGTTADANDDSVVARARQLLASDTQTLVVTLGAKGAQRITRDDALLVPAYRVKPVDTTGAGDAFNGGLAVGLAEGKTLDEAIRLAHATAALSVMKPGTAPSMPQRSEVEAFLQQQNGA